MFQNLKNISHLQRGNLQNTLWKLITKLEFEEIIILSKKYFQNI